MMIIVAVAAGLVTYAWVMGYVGFTTSKAGKAIQIQSIAYSAGTLGVYVQNVGDGTVTFITDECLYADGVLKPGGAVPGTLTEGETATITTAFTMVAGQTVKVRAVTKDGTFNEATYTYAG
jgi:predicted DNA-binding antitoxin AbrB/MazE fold protein